jgi:hypothetical protein
MTGLRNPPFRDATRDDAARVIKRWNAAIAAGRGTLILAVKYRREVRREAIAAADLAPRLGPPRAL